MQAIGQNFLMGTLAKIFRPAHGDGRTNQDLAVGKGNNVRDRVILKENTMHAPDGGGRDQRNFDFLREAVTGGGKERQGRLKLPLEQRKAARDLFLAIEQMQCGPDRIHASDN
jgi:hypothetical protein